MSSRLTLPLQVAPMLLWLVDAYVLIWLFLHHATGMGGLGGDGMREAMTRLVMFVLVLPLMLFPIVTIWAAGLRRVATDGIDLMITLSTGRTARVPLTSIVRVDEWRSVDLRTVTVTFDRKTPAGRRARFLAPTRFNVPKGEPHPVVLALRETVEAAQSSTTVFTERPRRPMLPQLAAPKKTAGVR